jgi:hypothetical protein
VTQPILDIDCWYIYSGEGNFFFHYAYVLVQLSSATVSRQRLDLSPACEKVHRWDIHHVQVT